MLSVVSPNVFENRERLIELGPVMQPIVYEHHASAVDFQKVSQYLSLISTFS